MALDVRDQANDIWIWYLARERLERLTLEPTFEQAGVWGHDGKTVIYALSTRDGAYAPRSLFRRPSDGTGTAEQLIQGTVTQVPSTVTPDGSALIFRVQMPRSKVGSSPAPARECIPSRAVLRFLRMSPSRFQAWRRRQTACALDDQSSCPRTSPHRVTTSEVQAIGDIVTSLQYVTSRPDARRPCAAAQHRVSVAFDLVPPRPEVRLATPPAPRASSESEGGPAHNESRRDVAHRHHRDPPARRDTRLSARRDRQLLSADSGVARGRHVRTSQ